MKAEADGESMKEERGIVVEEDFGGVGPLCYSYVA